jgi:single-strand DNA-binding protein
VLGPGENLLHAPGLCYSAGMASRSVNKVILIGHLGKDAETTFTPSGIARSRFSVATSRRWKDQQTGDWKEETDWSNVILWRGENVANYLLKGKQVYVEGRLRNYSYDDKDGKKVYATEVVADEVILLGGRGGDAGPGDELAGAGGGLQSMPRSAQQRPRTQAAPAQSQGGDGGFEGGITDDDVPF